MTQVACWVSIIAHPFVMVGVMVGAVAARQSSGGEAARSVLIVIAFTVAPLLVLMVRQVRKGRWTDADASNRRERPALYAVGALALAGLTAYLTLTHAPSFLLHGSAGTLIMFAICALLTRWIKVSLHMAFASLAATTLLLIGSPAGWVLLPLVPALAWARLRLNRHLPLEVALGIIIGCSAALAFVLI